MVKLVSGMGPAAVVLVGSLHMHYTERKKAVRVGSNRYCVRVTLSLPVTE